VAVLVNPKPAVVWPALFFVCVASALVAVGLCGSAGPEPNVGQSEPKTEDVAKIPIEPAKESTNVVRVPQGFP
jgi:hypothetical protein